MSAAGQVSRADWLIIFLYGLSNWLRLVLDDGDQSDIQTDSSDLPSSIDNRDVGFPKLRGVSVTKRLIGISPVNYDPESTIRKCKTSTYSRVHAFRYV